LLLFGDGVEGGGGFVDGSGEDGHLLLGSGAVFGVDGFVDSGDDDGCVAGIFAGGVDGVFEPGAVGEAGFGEEVSFDGSELGVECR
jgi:hypothetical protein